MSDIHKLLSKHFTGDATPKEDLLAQQFKLENPEEYETLQAFWTKKEIDLVEVNTAQAWQKVTQSGKPTKQVSLYKNLRIAASVAAVFLLVSFGYYSYTANNTSSELAEVKTQNQNEKVTLKDGSIVYLNNNSSISYPNAFASNQREVTLHGEAFFEIARDVNRPFVIHTNHSDVKVLGTSFNINTETEQTEISVATGKVKVSSLHSNESSVLTANQSALVNTKTMEVESTKNINYQAWKTGIFKFEKAAISEVVEELNTRYDNKIILSASNSDCSFSSTFNQEDLHNIVEVIQLSCDLKLKQKDGYYELY